MDPIRALIRVLLPAVLLAACAGVETASLMERADGLSPRAYVAGASFYPQEEKACGPATLAMALDWAGYPVSPEAASVQVYTPGREGTLTTDMVGGARRHGALAVPVRGLRAVLAEVNAGHPVVVLQNLGLEMKPVWHFALVVGYDLTERRILLHSGLEPDMPMALDTFEHTWKRAGGWAMVVLPPHTLPTTAPEREVVTAAAGLERAGRPDAAERAYRAVLVRWPDSAAAALGLGNALMAQGDLAGAEDAFGRAAWLDPSWPVAWNNLAHVLLQRGNPDEARSAALRAVALGGREGPWLETLAEAEKGGFRLPQ